MALMLMKMKTKFLLQGCRSNTDDLATIPFHLFLFLVAQVELAKSFPALFFNIVFFNVSWHHQKSNFQGLVIQSAVSLTKYLVEGLSQS